MTTKSHEYNKMIEFNMKILQMITGFNEIKNKKNEFLANVDEEKRNTFFPLKLVQNEKKKQTST